MLVIKNNDFFRLEKNSYSENPSTLSTSSTPSTTAFHLVDLSPWPFVASFSLFIMLSGAVLAFHGYNYGSLSIKIGAFLLVSAATLWWRDVTREGFQGQHTVPVTKGIKMGFSLFIISEIFLFIAFFWALFHSSLVPNIELGNVWPPLGIEPINPWIVPLLNAIILLSSGVTVTWAHHAIIASNYKSAIFGLIATIVLAIIFTALMVAEYYIASFDISDSVYGSCFYMLTGLHGSHIIVAIIFLLVSSYRLYKHHFSNLSFLGAELGILYYHFVDVVFLFVFGLVYWWSSGIELSLFDNSSVSNIHALTPLLFFKKSFIVFKNFNKGVLGLYIKFLQYCITSAILFNIIFLFSILSFADLNVITGPLFILINFIFLSFYTISIAVENEATRFYISDISGISESNLLKIFTFKHSLMIGGAIAAGSVLARTDDFLHRAARMSDFKAYVGHMKSLNEPLDNDVILALLTEKSLLVTFTEKLPFIFGY